MSTGAPASIAAAAPRTPLAVGAVLGAAENVVMAATLAAMALLPLPS